jgi:ubiquinone biosynthesis protein UbiJ
MIDLKHEFYFFQNEELKHQLSQTQQFAACFENISFENDDSRLEKMQELKNINQDMRRTRADEETLLKRSIPEVSAAISSSEARLVQAADSKTFETESRKLAELLTEKNEMTDKLR